MLNIIPSYYLGTCTKKKHGSAIVQMAEAAHFCQWKHYSTTARRIPWATAWHFNKSHFRGSNRQIE